MAVHDLDGYRLMLPGVVGEVYSGHPTAPDFALDQIAVAEGFSDWRG
jgi:hypothetical protein